MNDPDAAARAVKQAAVARRWLRARLVLWTVVTVVMVATMTGVWLWLQSVSAWEDDIRSEQPRTTAMVLQLIDESGKHADDRVVLSVMGERTQLVLHQAHLEHYREGAVVAVWYDPSRPERFATEFETNTTNRQSTVTLVLVLIGSVTAVIMLRWWVALRAVWFAWRGEVLQVKVTGMAARRVFKGDRTLISFDDARGPWSCRHVAVGAISEELTVIATDRHRVVCSTQPFVVRRAWWERTRRRWLIAVKTA